MVHEDMDAGGQRKPQKQSSSNGVDLRFVKAVSRGASPIRLAAKLGRGAFPSLDILIDFDVFPAPGVPRGPGRSPDQPGVCRQNDPHQIVLTFFQSSVAETHPGNLESERS